MKGAYLEVAGAVLGDGAANGRRRRVAYLAVLKIRPTDHVRHVMSCHLNAKKRDSRMCRMRRQGLANNARHVM